MYRGGAGYRVGGMRREKGKWGWHIKVLIRSPLTSKSKEIAWGRYVMKELTTRVPMVPRDSRSVGDVIYLDHPGFGL